MRLADYVDLLLVFTPLVLTICDTTSAIADTEQTSFAKDASINAVPLSPAGHHDSSIAIDTDRFLRSDSTTAEAHKTSATDEERGIIPASVRIAIKRLVTKDDTIYTHGRGKGREKEWWATLLKYHRKSKAKHDNYIRPLYWAIRFTVWIANKRTPAMMYNKLNVISSTGIGDRNYRIYINYLRFYEYFKGPTYSPLFVHGPKFNTKKTRN
ncbi:secreted RxLR effector peptide protein, putative [Phytophthora infestans T30-4]|uniref:Secreted RxLR effector peptide protein, putative n=1 Tax=Phytophthora infestans (strain T30-4) TaxID=403677 RepID=D0NX54_PHYIT|nr:secreted RxLR effector peptide protein, putative [Phytophthora infestans T30-4]EEY67649.1 secreted RxLR effector peptide protein, putative [Phytophthora infestans T30-4]|eukprot:XP_002896312.1 secreted RxLR effector peptide protein, putative [Phytophthora infestans T30-4]